MISTVSLPPMAYRLYEIYYFQNENQTFIGYGLSKNKINIVFMNSPWFSNCFQTYGPNKGPTYGTEMHFIVFNILQTASKCLESYLGT